MVALRVEKSQWQDWLLATPSRAEAFVAAHSHLHMSLSDIARALGLSVSRVSQIVTGAREPRASDHTKGAVQ